MWTLFGGVVDVVILSELQVFDFLRLLADFPSAGHVSLFSLF